MPTGTHVVNSPVSAALVAPTAAGSSKVTVTRLPSVVRLFFTVPSLNRAGLVVALAGTGLASQTSAHVEGDAIGVLQGTEVTEVLVLDERSSW